MIMMANVKGKKRVGRRKKSWLSNIGVDRDRVNRVWKMAVIPARASENTLSRRSQLL